MKAIDIIEQILIDNRELEKSTRYYNQTSKQRAEALIHQRTELKLFALPFVIKCPNCKTTEGIEDSKIKYDKFCTKCGQHFNLGFL